MAALTTWTHVLRLCLFLAPARGYMNSPERFMFKESVLRQKTTPKTKQSIHWPSAAPPVPLRKEIQLLQSGALLRRGEFGRLHGSRELELELECGELGGVSFDQALSIRTQLMMHKLLKNAWKLKEDEPTMHIIRKKFERKRTPLLEISREFDLSPVSIFRAIVSPRVLRANPRWSCLKTQKPAGRIVQSIISESDRENVDSYLMSEWELNELQIAKENDVVGYRSDICDTAAGEWEDAIYTFLDERGIEYITEESLKLQAGHDEQQGMGTPDCVLLDDLFINGQKVNWIEFKCFYASGLRENKFFTKKAITKQVEKYEAEFGNSGAVILKNGFSEGVSQRYPETLFLDGGPLHSGNEYHF